MINPIAVDACFGVDWLNLLERSAIREFDGGLDRKTSTLSACAELYPAEMKTMKAKVSAYPAGDSIIYEFLEGNINGTFGKNSITALNSDTILRETQTLSKNSTAVSCEIRLGMSALKYITGIGIPLIGVYDTKALIARKDDISSAYTHDMTAILSLIAGNGDKKHRARGVKIRRFSFIPRDAGLLCLDIDRKPGKPDGLLEFYKRFPPDTLPKRLQDIETYFPCYVKTPNNGYHLYFKYDGELIRNTNLCPGVEIKHQSLTAPGSVNKDGKPYTLHGRIENAIPLYEFLIYASTHKADSIVRIPSKKKKHLHQPRNPRQSMKQRIDLSVLADESVKAYSGHHDRQVSFSGRACRCKYTLAEALAYVTSNPHIFGSDPDTENTITSVYQANGGIS